MKKTPVKVKEKETPKQRGRGAFTYGGGGNLYSDQFDEDGATHERLNLTTSDRANDHCTFLVHKASPKKTRDHACLEISLVTRLAFQSYNNECTIDV